MSNVVSFTQMKHGTKADYELLQKLEDQFCEQLPDRILETLRRLEHSLGGYQVNRLTHCLQSATRAHEAGESEEMVVAALLHDIGDELAPHSHSEMAASILRPYVSDKTYWIVKTHGVFQMIYYAHHVGLDPNARDIYRDEEWYDDAVHFCEAYDQNCFDPNYEAKPLEFFEPMLRAVFSRPPWQQQQSQA